MIGALQAQQVVLAARLEVIKRAAERHSGIGSRAGTIVFRLMMIEFEAVQAELKAIEDYLR